MSTLSDPEALESVFPRSYPSFSNPEEAVRATSTGRSQAFQAPDGGMNTDSSNVKDPDKLKSYFTPGFDEERADGPFSSRPLNLTEVARLPRVHRSPPACRAGAAAVQFHRQRG